MPCPEPVFRHSDRHIRNMLDEYYFKAPYSYALTPLVASTLFHTEILWQDTFGFHLFIVRAKSVQPRLSL